MERYYDEILQAEESEDFTRGDMMVLLKAINDGTIGDAAAESPAEQETDQRFPDVLVDHYAFEAVEWAAQVGVTPVTPTARSNRSGLSSNVTRWCSWNATTTRSFKPRSQRTSPAAT